MKNLSKLTLILGISILFITTGCFLPSKHTKFRSLLLDVATKSEVLGESLETIAPTGNFRIDRAHTNLASVQYDLATIFRKAAKENDNHLTGLANSVSFRNALKESIQNLRLLKPYLTGRAQLAASNLIQAEENLLDHLELKEF
jgi:hypothetical protein